MEATGVIVPSLHPVPILEMLGMREAVPHPVYLHDINWDNLTLCIFYGRKYFYFSNLRTLFYNFPGEYEVSREENCRSALHGP